MIRVHVTRDEFDDEGGWIIYMTGHAGTRVCAGISAIFYTAFLGIKWIAGKYPGECLLFENGVDSQGRGNGKVESNLMNYEI